MDEFWHGTTSGTGLACCPSSPDHRKSHEVPSDWSSLCLKHRSPSERASPTPGPTWRPSSRSSSSSSLSHSPPSPIGLPTGRMSTGESEPAPRTAVTPRSFGRSYPAGSTARRSAADGAPKGRRMLVKARCSATGIPADRGDSVGAEDSLGIRGRLHARLGHHLPGRGWPFLHPSCAGRRCPSPSSWCAPWRSQRSSLSICPASRPLRRAAVTAGRKVRLHDRARSGWVGTGVLTSLLKPVQ